MKNGYLDFDEYIRQGEPQKKERAEAWRVAIGLQAVDGLTTSEYLHEIARRNIERLAKFISGLWQIHPFREGNTRTTAVFAIKYLRSQGFQVNNNLFEQHSWYFRNALVRANYRNLSKGIAYEPKFLIYFFRNLLLGENNVLKNRYMIINSTDSFNIPEQVPEQVIDLLHTNNVLVINLIKTVGRNEYSISQLMEKLELKHRPNFLEYHLNPAISEGYIRMLYPNSPRHPKQKYLLTVKGLALYNELIKNKNKN